jgi:hypothetical protein
MTTSNATSTESISTAASQEEQMLQEQQQMNLQQERFETQSAMQQSRHDTMMSIIRAIAS